jgi:hypothetical protein
VPPPTPYLAPPGGNHKRPATPTPIDYEHICTRPRRTEVSMREAPPSLDILYARLYEEVEGLREEVLEKDEAIRVLGRRVTEQDGEIARLLRKVVDAEEEAKMLRELRRALDEAEKSWMLAGEDDMMEEV